MRGIRVLHVDDDQQFREVTAEWLARLDDDIDVVTEGSVADALDLLSRESEAIDCVVSDYDMPGTDGLDFLDAVREEHPQLPFLLFTGKGSEQVASDAMARDATGYLQKRGGREQYELLANRIRNAVEQYRSRRRVERQREEYRHLFEEAPVMFVIYRDEGGVPVVEDCNRRFAAKLGYDRAELEGESIESFFTAESLPDAMDGYERALAGERVSTTHEVRGAVFDTTLQPVLEDGAVEAVIGVAVDITERTERERELRRFEAIVEALGDAVYAVDGERRLEYVNERYAEMKGLDREELLGMSTERWADEEVIDRITELSEELKRGEREVAAVEYESRTADGETIPVENRFIRTEFPDGEWGRVGVIRDISDRVERERELERERDRLDEFASVVSHDLRNPLHTLDASLRLVDADDEHVARCRRAVDRMDRLIDDLLTLARRGDRVGDPEPVALAEVVTDAWRTVETADIDLTVETDGTVLADEGRLRQLFENLFRNAVEHGSTDTGSPDGAASVPGVEEVTVGTLPHGEGFYIADDGVGFPQPGPGRVFESGYSTDSDSVGLGLAIVEGVASGHGWDVTATESESGGARFEFTGVDWQ